MKAIANVDARAVDYRNEHILYVEGDEHSIDATVLNVLLGNILWIQPLGQASSIQSAAKSLYPTHPKSYFLIDRDHHVTNKQIDAYWRNFPDLATHNLLVWRRRAFENYFLDPAFLIQSRFCNDKYKANGGQRLQEKIVSLASGRLYLEVANYVIASLREDFKKNWIDIFSNPSEFPDETAALERLAQMQEFTDFAKKVTQQVAKQAIEARFQLYFNKMTGGSNPLQWEVGDWVSMVSGKRIFHSLVGLCFHVTNPNQAGKVLQGKDAINLVARDLLLTGENLPHDFIKLKKLIEQRVRG